VGPPRATAPAPAPREGPRVALKARMRAMWG
jgi:hypothetical protein